MTAPSGEYAAFLRELEANHVQFPGPMVAETFEHQSARLPPTIPASTCDCDGPAPRTTIAPQPPAEPILESNLPARAAEDVKPFPFMDLPSELRVHIYRMALSRDKPILLHLSRRTPEPAQPDAIPGDDLSDSDPEFAELRAEYPFPRSQRSRRALAPRRARPSAPPPPPSEPLHLPPHETNGEPIAAALLRVSKLVYREARPVLYGDNAFALELSSATATLGALHQRSRSAIKHVLLRVPTHHDILEGFADLVRLGLRYCWGLQTFTIALPGGLPEERSAGAAGGASVYANAFHILRWLPKKCVVRLEGCASDEIRKVVEENGVLARELDEVSALHHHAWDR